MSSNNYSKKKNPHPFVINKRLVESKIDKLDDEVIKGFIIVIIIIIMFMTRRMKKKLGRARD